MILNWFFKNDFEWNKNRLKLKLKLNRFLNKFWIEISNGLILVLNDFEFKMNIIQNNSI